MVVRTRGKIVIEAEDTRAAEKMREVNAILGMVADKKGCQVSDLEWRRDKFGAIHIRRKKDAVST